MTSLHRALWGLAAAGVVGGGIALAFVLTSDHLPARGVAAAVGPLVGWGFIAAGLIAWARRPENRTGALMTAVGFAWFAAALTTANIGEVYVVGALFGSITYGLLIHMLVAFPEGRLRTRFERLLVGVAYFDTTVVQVATVPFDDPRHRDCDCPSNPLLVTDDERVYDAILGFQSVCGVLGVGALIALLAVRWRRVGPAQRRVLTPVYVTGLAVLAILLVSLAADVTGVPDGAAEDALDAVGLFALASVPFAFLAGLLRSRLSRDAAVSELVARLGGDAERRRGIREALADALGDPSLELAYWVPERRGYVDAAGRPVTLPDEKSARAWTGVERDGRPVAALVHDRALADEPELIRAAGAAATLALDNERLDAELRAKVEELRASRARLVGTADRERRRLERDLHDGAQQRLVALALSLRLARSKLESDPAASAALLDEAQSEVARAATELRELARGIHPAVLSDRGLSAAVEALAGRAPLPVEVKGMPEERLPDAVEATAYFVIAEALTNVARYAEATHAEIRVGREDGRVIVEVADDGVGGADPGRGSGLRGLADRVATLDGRLRVESETGAGTTVRADIPCA